MNKEIKYVEEVQKCAEKIQEQIPGVLRETELVYWTSALLRTAAELAHCGGFDESLTHDVLQTYMDMIKEMAVITEYHSEQIH